MSEYFLSRYCETRKTGIDPRSFPAEPFYYYSLPDFDEGKGVAATLGRQIESHKFLVRNESLLISKLNPRIRRVWLVRNDERFRSVASTEFVNLEAHAECSLDFLYYFLQNDDVFSRLEAEAVGTTNSHVRFKPDLILRLPASFPQKTVQRKIARILTTLDELIQKTEALIAKYQAIKQGMMHDLFTHGVDSCGHLRPTYDEAPELYKESELGWIPREWEVCQWKDFVTKWSYGPRFSAKNYSDFGNVRTIRGTDFTNDGSIYYRQVPLALLPQRMVPWHELKQNDLVIVTTADCGVSAVFEEQECPFIASAYAVAYRLDDSVNPHFINYCMRTYKAKRQVNKYIRQGTVGNLPGSDVLAFLIAQPIASEQDACVKRLESLSERVRREQDNLQKLSIIKTGLMQDLLTGKVRVKVDEEAEDV